MARQRITEDFVKHLNLLKQRSGNSPHGILSALERDPQVAISIRELRSMSYQIKNHKNYSNHRFITQAHPEFSKEFEDYCKRWRYAWLALKDWEDEKAGREKMSTRILQEFSELSDKLESSVGSVLI